MIMDHQTISNAIFDELNLAFTQRTETKVLVGQGLEVQYSHEVLISKTSDCR